MAASWELLGGPFMAALGEFLWGDRWQRKQQRKVGATRAAKSVKHAAESTCKAFTKSVGIFKFCRIASKGKKSHNNTKTFLQRFLRRFLRRFCGAFCYMFRAFCGRFCGPFCGGFCCCAFVARGIFLVAHGKSLGVSRNLLGAPWEFFLELVGSPSRQPPGDLLACS